MRMPDERPEKRTSPGEKVAKGSLHGVNQIVEDGGEHMLRNLPKLTRFVAKRAPGIGLDLVLGTGEVLAAKPEDKMRKAFGVAGGFLGSVGGGGLGLLTGPAAPIAAPVGAAVGGAFGENIGTDIYDRNKAVIDRDVANVVGGARRTGAAIADEFHVAHQKLDDTRRWMEDRNADLRRRFGR
jgi:hypothetical protein